MHRFSLSKIMHLIKYPVFSILMFAVTGCQIKQAESNSTDNFSKTEAAVITADNQAQTNNKLIVYYFHGSMRCPTCHKLENYAKSEIESSFSDEIKAGKLEWKSINVEENGNEHFTDYYKLYTKSVIVSIHKDTSESAWKNLDKIWQLVHDEQKYRQYIRDEVKACLNGTCL